MEKIQTHKMYGFVTGIAMVIVGLILYISGLAFKSGMQWISYIPFLVGMVLNANAFSKANDGYVTFGNVFGSCFKSSMIVAIVMVAYSILTIFIFPEMKERIISMQREELLKNPKMTEEAIDMAQNMTRKFWNVFLIGGAVLGTLFMGAIFSLVGATAVKKNGERPFGAGDNF
jgi:hypothetical protein